MKKYREVILYTVLILFLFVFAVSKTYPKIVNFINIAKDIAQKSSFETDLDRKLRSLKSETDAEKAARELSTSLKTIYKPELPGEDTETYFTVVFDDIINIAKYNGVKVYSIEYAYNPSDDEFVTAASNQYNVCRLKMDVIADYTDLEGFLKEVYKYPYLINIDSIRAVPYQKNKRILLIQIQFKLYALK